MSSRYTTLGVGLVVLLQASASQGQVQDPAFADVMVVSSPNLVRATSFAWAPDGSNRLFVTRQAGDIRIVKDGVLLPTAFATITPIFDFSECGLLGLEFDPNFLVNRYVYVFATVSAQEQQIIRYTVDGDVGTEKTVLVTKLPTLGVNHDGGALGFGPDGKLYWGVGDNAGGAAPNRGDELTTLLAKIGRANRDGTPVADNPFADGAGPQNEHIFARGFRNPYSLTFQPSTGLLWVASVGEVYEQVFIVRRGDHAGWGTVKYEANQPTGFIRPVLRYKTNAVDVLPLADMAASGAVRAAGSVTFKTTAAHGLLLGDNVTVKGAADPSLNAQYFVTGLPSPTSFTVKQAGPDVTSGGGTVTTALLGGSVVGGVFYDATAAPAAYRGNYFWADYNTGGIGRATIDAASNTVTSVAIWGGGHHLLTDLSVGPEGALYYLHQTLGSIYRHEYKATSQALIVSQTHLWLAEGEPRLITVRLAQDPGGTVAVTVARASGDADVAVTMGQSLSFTSANWNRPQPVIVTAGRDLDATEDLATFTVSAPALASESVNARVRDDNALALQVSPGQQTWAEASRFSLSVSLSQAPSIDVEVTAKSIGDPDVAVTSGAAFRFTRANWMQPQLVELVALSDADGVDDVGRIEVSAPGMAPVLATVNVTDDDRGAGAPDAPVEAGTSDAAREVASSETGDAPSGDARDAGSRDVTADQAGDDDADDGCGCRLGARPRGKFNLIAGVAIVALLIARRRREGPPR